MLSVVMATLITLGVVCIVIGLAIGQVEHLW